MEGRSPGFADRLNVGFGRKTGAKGEFVLSDRKDAAVISCISGWGGRGWGR